MNHYKKILLTTLLIVILLTSGCALLAREQIKEGEKRLGNVINSGNETLSLDNNTELNENQLEVRSVLVDYQFEVRSILVKSSVANQTINNFETIVNIAPGSKNILLNETQISTEYANKENTLTLGECESQDYFCYTVMNGNEDNIVTPGERIKLISSYPEDIPAGEKITFTIHTMGDHEEINLTVPKTISSSHVRLY